jgi:hypothetical protein
MPAGQPRCIGAGASTPSFRDPYNPVEDPPSTARIDRTTKRALYARYGVAYLWLLDVDAPVIEAHVLRDREYAVVATASGAEPVDLPPFTGVDLVRPSLWPSLPIQP